MKRTTTILVGFIFALAVGTLLWPTLGSQAQAQSGCKSFEAIAQAALPSSTPLFKTFDLWGGPLYGMIGSELLPQGVLSGNDGQDSWHGAIGIGRGGSYTVCTNYPVCSDTFTYEVPNAVFPAPPGQGGLMRYIGNTAKIVQGTGRFLSASGNLNITGPAIAWPDNSPNNPIGFLGRWNAELSGKVCGVQ
jgi:hypothetical protein